jgi:hypothetical protein
MRSETEQTKVFYAEDGSRFLNEDDCKTHEASEQRRKDRAERTRFYAVTNSPDLTEGRGWYGCLYIACESEYRGKDDTNALAACVTLFGNPLAFVQGCAPMANWSVVETTRENFESFKKHRPRVGDYSHPSSALFISDKGPVDGWPEPVPVSKLLDKKFVEAHVVKASQR